MKHQTKQTLAWFIAFGASGVLFGTGSWYLKKVAARTSEHRDTHADESHTEKPEATNNDSHSEHPSAAAHHEGGGHEGGGHESKDSDKKAGSHGNGDATKESEPKPIHHSSNKSDDHKAPEEHGAKEHGATKDNKKDNKNSKQNKKGHHDGHTSIEPDHKGSLAKEESHPTQELKSLDTPSHAANSAPHWSYLTTDKGGPSHWGSVSENFAQCEKGREQSPINLKTSVTRADAPKITWVYNPVAVKVENNGHTIVANMPNTQNHITIDGEKYTLAQFHFHSPSEHRIGGIPSEMEMHFVHKNSKGQLAVIGVMLHEKAATENLFLKPLWQILPRELHQKSEETPTLNLAKLLPVHKDYFHYAGSLTTPPCSQGVRWFVLKDAVTMSGSQIDLYTGIFGGPTNRPVQPLFGREVIQSEGPAMVAH